MPNILPYFTILFTCCMILRFVELSFSDFPSDSHAPVGLFLLCKITAFRQDGKYRPAIWAGFAGSLPQIAPIWVFRQFLSIFPAFPASWKSDFPA